MIIHIDGVQGSGKSYICSKIKNIKCSIKCIDTDDIMKEAINIIETSQNTNNKMPRTIKQLDKIKKQIVDYYIKKYDNIIFAGITVTIINPDYKFFIKITDFSNVYKRLLLRELNKIIKNKNKIIKHITMEDDPKEIEIQRIADLSLRFPFEYDSFIKDYKERLKEAKNKKYVIKTQEEIIDFIKSLKY
jgi:hypothetical protein